MSNVATKNGLVIVKNGGVAESCACCCPRISEPDSVRIVLSSTSVDEFIYAITCRKSFDLSSPIYNGAYNNLKGSWDCNRRYRAVLGDLSGTYELTKFTEYGPYLQDGLTSAHAVYKYVDKKVLMYMAVTTGDYAVDGFYTSSNAVWTLNLWFPRIAIQDHDVGINWVTGQTTSPLPSPSIGDMASGAMNAGDGEYVNAIISQVCTRGAPSEAHGQWSQAGFPLAVTTFDSAWSHESVQEVVLTGREPVSQYEQPQLGGNFARTAYVYSYFAPSLPLQVQAQYHLYRPSCCSLPVFLTNGASGMGNSLYAYPSNCTESAMQTNFDDGAFELQRPVPIDVSVDAIALVYAGEEVSLPL